MHAGKLYERMRERDLDLSVNIGVLITPSAPRSMFVGWWDCYGSLPATLGLRYKVLCDEFTANYDDQWFQYEGDDSTSEGLIYWRLRFGWNDPGPTQYYEGELKLDGNVLWTRKLDNYPQASIPASGGSLDFPGTPMPYPAIFNKGQLTFQTAPCRYSAVKWDGTGATPWDF